MRTATTLLFLVFFFGYLFGTAGTVFFTNIRMDPQLSQPAGKFTDVTPGDTFAMLKNSTNGTNITTSTIRVPAVNQDKQGVATFLTVSVVPGFGRTLVNIDKLLFWVDTQSSIRTSRIVADDVLGLDLSSVDTIYTITADASVIEGGSAGAALTIATIAALENKPINEKVMITGTINPDGTVGPIGEAHAKAQVAKELGATVFLVPRGQSTQVVYQDKQTCEKVGLSDLCTTEKVPFRIDIEEDVGITVVEVLTINDAVEYFFEG